MRGNGGVKPDGSYALNVNGRIGVDAAQGLNVHISPLVAQVLKRVSGTRALRTARARRQERAAAQSRRVPI